MLAWLRQWKYPKEFRIAQPESSSADMHPLTTILGALRAARPATPAVVPGKALSTIAPAQLAELATGLWRLRIRMLDTAARAPTDDVRRACRHMESTWDVLIQAGLTIQDHAHSPYDPGLSLKVIAFQPTPGLVRDTVIETIRPTVYFKDEPIQMGEVVVGTPG